MNNSQYYEDLNEDGNSIRQKSYNIFSLYYFFFQKQISASKRVTIDVSSDESTSLECRTIRIGSHKFTPTEKVS